MEKDKKIQKKKKKKTTGVKRLYGAAEENLWNKDGPLYGYKKIPWAVKATGKNSYTVKSLIKGDTNLEENMVLRTISILGFPRSPSNDIKVDAYYPEYKVFIELHETQHVDPTDFRMSGPGKFKAQQEGDQRKARALVEQGFYGLIVLGFDGPFASTTRNEPRWERISNAEVRKRVEDGLTVMMEMRARNYVKQDYAGRMLVASTPMIQAKPCKRDQRPIDEACLDSAGFGKRFLGFEAIEAAGRVAALQFDPSYIAILQAMQNKFASKVIMASNSLTDGAPSSPRSVSPGGSTDSNSSDDDNDDGGGDSGPEESISANLQEPFNRCEQCDFQRANVWSGNPRRLFCSQKCSDGFWTKHAKKRKNHVLIGDRWDRLPKEIRRMIVSKAPLLTQIGMTGVSKAERDAIRLAPPDDPYWRALFEPDGIFEKTFKIPSPGDDRPYLRNWRDTALAVIQSRSYLILNEEKQPAQFYVPKGPLHVGNEEAHIRVWFQNKIGDVFKKPDYFNVTRMRIDNPGALLRLRGYYQGDGILPRPEYIQFRFDCVTTDEGGETRRHADAFTSESIRISELLLKASRVDGSIDDNVEIDMKEVTPLRTSVPRIQQQQGITLIVSVFIQFTDRDERDDHGKPMNPRDIKVSSHGVRYMDKRGHLVNISHDIASASLFFRDSFASDAEQLYFQTTRLDFDIDSDDNDEEPDEESYSLGLPYTVHVSVYQPSEAREAQLRQSRNDSASAWLAACRQNDARLLYSSSRLGYDESSVRGSLSVRMFTRGYYDHASDIKSQWSQLSSASGYVVAVDHGMSRIKEHGQYYIDMTATKKDVVAGIDGFAHPARRYFTMTKESHVVFRQLIIALPGGLIPYVTGPDEPLRFTYWELAREYGRVREIIPSTHLPTAQDPTDYVESKYDTQEVVRIVATKGDEKRIASSLQTARIGDSWDILPKDVRRIIVSNAPLMTQIAMTGVSKADQSAIRLAPPDDPYWRALFEPGGIFEKTFKIPYPANGRPYLNSWRDTALAIIQSRTYLIKNAQGNPSQFFVPRGLLVSNDTPHIRIWLDHKIKEFYTSKPHELRINRVQIDNSGAFASMKDGSGAALLPPPASVALEFQYRNSVGIRSVSISLRNTSLSEPVRQRTDLFMRPKRLLSNIGTTLAIPIHFGFDLSSSDSDDEDDDDMPEEMTASIGAVMVYKNTQEDPDAPWQSRVLASVFFRDEFASNADEIVTSAPKIKIRKLSPAQGDDEDSDEEEEDDDDRARISKPLSPLPYAVHIGVYQPSLERVNKLIQSKTTDADMWMRACRREDARLLYTEIMPGHAQGVTGALSIRMFTVLYESEPRAAMTTTTTAPASNEGGATSEVVSVPDMSNYMLHFDHAMSRIKDPRVSIEMPKKAGVSGDSNDARSSVAFYQLRIRLPSVLWNRRADFSYWEITRTPEQKIEIIPSTESMRIYEQFGDEEDEIDETKIVRIVATKGDEQRIARPIQSLISSNWSDLPAEVRRIVHSKRPLLDQFAATRISKSEQRAFQLAPADDPYWKSLFEPGGTFEKTFKIPSPADSNAPYLKTWRDTVLTVIQSRSYLIKNARGRPERFVVPRGLLMDANQVHIRVWLDHDLSGFTAKPKAIRVGRVHIENSGALSQLLTSSGAAIPVPEYLRLHIGRTFTGSDTHVLIKFQDVSREQAFIVTDYTDRVDSKHNDRFFIPKDLSESYATGNKEALRAHIRLKYEDSPDYDNDNGEEDVSASIASVSYEDKQYVFRKLRWRTVLVSIFFRDSFVSNADKVLLRSPSVNLKRVSTGPYAPQVPDEVDTEDEIPPTSELVYSVRAEVYRPSEARENALLRSKTKDSVRWMQACREPDARLMYGETLPGSYNGGKSVKGSLSVRMFAMPHNVELSKAPSEDGSDYRLGFDHGASRIKDGDRQLEFLDDEALRLANYTYKLYGFGLVFRQLRIRLPDALSVHLRQDRYRFSYWEFMHASERRMEIIPSSDDTRIYRTDYEVEDADAIDLPSIVRITATKGDDSNIAASLVQ